MKYLLDTHVISEPFKRRPHPDVMRWLDSHSPESLHLCALSMGEMRRGVERLADGIRRDRILRFLDGEYRDWFGDRILPVDERVAQVWGTLEAGSPRTVPTVDALIAATVLAHGLTLVTRNGRDFPFPGLQVLDPWSKGGGEGAYVPGIEEPKARYRRALKQR